MGGHQHPSLAPSSGRACAAVTERETGTERIRGGALTSSVAGDPTFSSASLPGSRLSGWHPPCPCPGITRAGRARLLKAACLRALRIRSRTCPLAHRCIPSAYDAQGWSFLFDPPCPGPGPLFPLPASEIPPPHCCPGMCQSRAPRVQCPSPKPFRASSRLGQGRERPARDKTREIR